MNVHNMSLGVSKIFRVLKNFGKLKKMKFKFRLYGQLDLTLKTNFYDVVYININLNL